MTYFQQLEYKGTRLFEPHFLNECHFNEESLHCRSDIDIPQVSRDGSAIGDRFYYH